MSEAWKRVYVFISSTFNDMHAERDYLVKNVFPELRDWCEKRKLRLIDVDLRWGITEVDATSNSGVVKACLKRIDDCRPFFLCFLGQRYGWIPTKQNISPETFAEYPGLEHAAADGASVTELEILHAITKPFHLDCDDLRKRESRLSVKHAYIYLRDPSYLSQIPSEPLKLRRVYTDEAASDPDFRAVQLSRLTRLKQRIVKTGRPIRHYEANWDPAQRTPEIALPVKCPALLPENARRWRNEWQEILGEEVSGSTVPPANIRKAQDYNRALTAGRLTDFQCGQESLGEVIIQDLQTAIAARYPEHLEIPDIGGLQKEIDQQEEFLFANSEGFVEREHDFDELDAYALDNSSQIFVLTGKSGVGKSMLLTNWVQRFRDQPGRFPDTTFHFRFIGQSEYSTTVPDLLYYLLRELQEVAKKIPFETEIQRDPVKVRNLWLEQIRSLDQHHRTVIVIDALNQLETGLDDLEWLCINSLPRNVKIVVSAKSTPDGDREEAFRRIDTYLTDGVRYANVTPFEKLDDRRRLVNDYLAQHLKELDQRHVEDLIRIEGAENPLFLKVSLSELRVFGSFSRLADKIHSDFGKTPLSAFFAVLERLGGDPTYSPLSSGNPVPMFFSFIAHARKGLTTRELVDLLLQASGRNVTDQQQRTDAKETINIILRQVRSFFACRESRHDFFYESFKLAALEKYSGEITPEEPGKRPECEWHAEIARYLRGQVDENPRKLDDLIYHLVHGGDDEGIRACFEQGFIGIKREKGCHVSEIDRDFRLALDYFKEKGDMASMIAITAASATGESVERLENNESFLIWQGAVLAAQNDTAGIKRWIDCLEECPPGAEQLRMIAEFLIGLTDHQTVHSFRSRYEGRLRQALDGEPSESGLDLLAAEALGDVNLAFERAGETDAYLPQRLCRALKLIRRHPNHKLAEWVIEQLLDQVEGGVTTQTKQGSFDSTRDAVCASAGLPVDYHGIDLLLDRLSDIVPNGSNSTYWARHLALFLAGRPEFQDYWLEQLADLSPEEVSIPEFQIALFFIAWFTPELGSHPLVHRLVLARQENSQSLVGFHCLRGQILRAHMSELKFIGQGAYYAHEAMLVPLFSLWGKILDNDITNMETIAPPTELLPPFEECFPRNSSHFASWIEMGQVMCCTGKLELATQLLRRFDHEALTPRQPRGFLSFLFWGVVIIPITLIGMFTLALCFTMLETVINLGIAYLGVIFYPRAHFYALRRGKSRQLVKLFEKREARGKKAPIPLVLNGTWQFASSSLLEAGRPELATLAVPSPKHCDVAILFSELRFERWNDPNQRRWLREIIDKVHLNSNLDRELWLSFFDQLNALKRGNTTSILPDSGLKLAAKDLITFPRLFRLVRQTSGNRRVTISSKKEVMSLASALANIEDDNNLIEACRAARQLYFKDQELLNSFLAEALRIAMRHPRVVLIEIFHAVTLWRRTKAPGLSRRRMRREYVAVVRTEVFKIPLWFANPIVFPVFRFFYQGLSLCLREDYHRPGDIFNIAMRRIRRRLWRS